MNNLKSPLNGKGNKVVCSGIFGRFSMSRGSVRGEFWHIYAPCDGISFFKGSGMLYNCFFNEIRWFDICPVPKSLVKLVRLLSSKMAIKNLIGDCFGVIRQDVNPGTAL